MKSRAGLKKVVKTVRTKHGVKRQGFWVRAGGAVKGFAQRHSGLLKTAGIAAVTAAALYGGHKFATSERGIAARAKAGELYGSARSRAGELYGSARSRAGELYGSARNRLRPAVSTQYAAHPSSVALRPSDTAPGHNVVLHAHNVPGAAHAGSGQGNSGVAMALHQPGLLERGAALLRGAPESGSVVRRGTPAEREQRYPRNFHPGLQAPYYRPFGG